MLWPGLFAGLRGFMLPLLGYAGLALLVLRLVIDRRRGRRPAETLRTLLTRIPADNFALALLNDLLLFAVYLAAAGLLVALVGAWGASLGR